MTAPGETRGRLVWRMFVACCVCTTLLVLPIDWKTYWSSSGIPNAITHVHDVAANYGLSTSVWKSSEPADRLVAAPTKTWRLPKDEKYMWYSPHEGFSNQARELMNALKIAFLLNRTLVLPPVLDHFEVAHGKCLRPVHSQHKLRKHAWAAITRRFDGSSPGPYVAMADIIDLSSIRSKVKTIDLRVFLALWCGIDISRTCAGPMCHTVARELQSTPLRSISKCAAKFFSTSEGQGWRNLIHEVPDNCRTTVWTIEESVSAKLFLEERLRDQLHSDRTLPSEINASSISIERKDVIKALGPASTAGNSFLLAFGSLFSRGYKGGSLMVDITAPPGNKVAAILSAIEFQTFSVDILDSGRYFVQEKIMGPFFCAHARLNDGAFRSDQEPKIWRPLRKRLEKLEGMTNRSTSGPLNLFLMTDLPHEQWQGTYLHDLDINPKYKIHTMDGEEDRFNHVIRKIHSREYGLLSGFLPHPKYLRKIASRDEDEIIPGKKTDEENRKAQAFDVRLFVEEVVCSCATLGFQGTRGSTITRNILKIREAPTCPI